MKNPKIKENVKIENLKGVKSEKEKVVESKEKIKESDMLPSSEISEELENKEFDDKQMSDINFLNMFNDVEQQSPETESQEKTDNNNEKLMEEKEINNNGNSLQDIKTHNNNIGSNNPTKIIGNIEKNNNGHSFF